MEKWLPAYLFIFFLVVKHSIAQEVVIFESVDAEVERSEAALAAIRNGYLIIRLESNSKKIASLEKTLKNPKLKPKAKERLNKLLEDTKTATRQNNQTILQAFKKAYEFSPVRFMYDYDTPKLKDRQMSGYFLNDFLELDSTIQLDTFSFVTGRFGRTDPQESGQSVEAIILTDSDLKDLKKPFPNVFMLHHIHSITGSIAPGSNQELRNAVYWVGKINASLHNYSGANYYDSARDKVKALKRKKN